MIGDRNIDFDKGVEAGLLAENIILVEYGWGYDRSKMENNQKFMVNKPSDLIPAIKYIEKK